MDINVSQIVKDIIIEHMGVIIKEVTDTALLEDDLLLDSLDAIEIVMALEDDLDIEIPDEDFIDIKTVKELIDYISKRIS
jgi:acyl carrier protein